MPSDIKLEDDTLVLEGTFTRVASHDLLLDAPDRRLSQGGVRRALVHDREDGLTINYGGDYPGGVSIRGRARALELDVENALEIGGRAFARKEGAGTAGERIVIGVADDTNALQVEGRGVQVDGALHVRGEAYFDEAPRVPDVSLPGSGGGASQSLTQALAELRELNAALAARVQALEEAG